MFSSVYIHVLYFLVANCIIVLHFQSITAMISFNILMTLNQEGFDKNFLGMNYTVSFTPSGRGEGEGPSPRTEREAREVRRERHALNWTPTPGVQLGEQTHV